MIEKTTKVSVIIPAYNASGTIDACLNSVKNLDPPALEIIVVDDASTDNTAILARRKNVQVIRLERNQGPGQARNKGAKKALGEYIAFTDSDCIVPRDWLKKFQTKFATDNFCGITGPYSGPGRPHLIAKIIDRWLRYNQRKIPDNIVSCITSNMFVKQKDFLDLEGFPSYKLPGSNDFYWGNEDEEFAWLLSKKTGKKFYWMRDNGCQHIYRNSLSAHYRQQKFWVKSILISFARYPELSEGDSNYSSTGPALSIIFTILMVSSIFSGIILNPLYFLGIIPFLIFNAVSVYNVSEPEQGIGKKIGMAFLGYLFIAFTSIAWLQGLLIGGLMYFKCLYVWRK